MVAQTDRKLSLAEMREAVRGDNPDRLTGEECRHALVYLLAYTRAYGSRGNWTNQAIGQAVQNQLNARVEQTPAEPASETILPDAMTAGQVAAYLYVDVQTVGDWVRSGALASHVIPGGFRRFHPADVRALLGSAK
jgi:excisionase family DNA binding protein